jgi:hypothetical protein
MVLVICVYMPVPRERLTKGDLRRWDGRTRRLRRRDIFAGSVLAVVLASLGNMRKLRGAREPRQRAFGLASLLFIVVLVWVQGASASPRHEAWQAQSPIGGGILDTRDRGYW